jgi:hypothetical protein
MVFVRLVAIMAFAGALARPVSAQIYETVGIRAQGMAGGLRRGGRRFDGHLVEPGGPGHGRLLQRQCRAPHREGRSDESTLGVSLMVPSLGSATTGVRVGASAQFTDPRTVGPDRIVSLTSWRHDRSVARRIPGRGVDGEAGASGPVRGDLDLGALMKVGSVRLGISARNMVAPDLTVDGISGRAQAPGADRRGVRARGSRRLAHRAVDADLTTTATVAVQAARRGRCRSAGRTAWLRGGVSVNTVAEAGRRSVEAQLAVRRGCSSTRTVTGVTTTR